MSERPVEKLKMLSLCEPMSGWLPQWQRAPSTGLTWGPGEVATGNETRPLRRRHHSRVNLLHPYKGLRPSQEWLSGL